MDKCEHGAEREGHKNWPAGIGFTEPLNPCSCCGTLFYYIESVMGPFREPDEAGQMRNYWKGRDYEPKDLCELCGGTYRSFREMDKPDDSPAPPSLQERLDAYKARKRDAASAPESRDG